MKSYTEFVAESREAAGKLRHLEHLEDQPISDKEDGFEHSRSVLLGLRDLLNGKSSKVTASVKYDGSPSLVFGHHPQNGRFFVATKSAFNKKPKLNFTDEDVDRNHGRSPGLVQKLRAALAVLPSVTPKTGVFQGDLMYGPGDVSTKDGAVSFTPNVLSYSAGADTDLGRRVATSEIGLVVHTQYKGKTLADMRATGDVDLSRFKKSPTIVLIDPAVGETRGLTDSEQKRFEDALRAASELHGVLTGPGYETLRSQESAIKTYVNSTVRTGEKPTTRGYLDFVTERGTKAVEALKTDRGRDGRRRQFTALVARVEESRERFDDLFAMHAQLQRAKAVLLGVLARASPFENSVGGRRTAPEGVVATYEGRPVKLVDRAEFSRLNFARGGPETKGPVVFAFGRMNPPTAGHQLLVDKVASEAQRRGAHHEVVLSASVDHDRNPLAPEDKLAFARAAFPGTNLSLATSSHPTFVDQVRRLYAAGHDSLVMVAGADRVAEYKRLLDRYNGPDKNFNFKKIEVVSAGDRDARSTGLAGVSGSRTRALAAANDFGGFRETLPPGLTATHQKRLFAAVRKGSRIVIDSSTSARALGQYARRVDDVGRRARTELGRRKRVDDK